MQVSENSIFVVDSYGTVITVLALFFMDWT